MKGGGNGILDGLEEAGLPDSTSAVLKKPVGEVAQDIRGPGKETPMPSLTTHVLGGCRS